MDTSLYEFPTDSKNQNHFRSQIAREIEPLKSITIHYNFQIPLELVKANQFSLIQKGG
ncbi:MAG: hypothetical protein NG747_10495 [Candidatus Brocadia sp.]|nr:hypothetical protein [Candidatus Brocadia sp.]